MILLDILTTRAALALADGECANWLTRPCRQTIPDEHLRDEQPQGLRRGGEVDFVNFHEAEVDHG